MRLGTLIDSDESKPPGRIVGCWTSGDIAGRPALQGRDYISNRPRMLNTVTSSLARLSGGSLMYVTTVVTDSSLLTCTL